MRVATELGAIVSIAVLAMSPAAAAGVASATVFTGAHYDANFVNTKTGCVTLKTSSPKWSRATGVGTMRAATTAATCSAIRGGPSFESNSEGNPTLSVFAPVRVPTGAGGVNVSWTFTVSGSLSLAAPAKAHCPATRTTSDVFYSSWYNSSSGSTVSTWDNYTDLYTLCEVGNEVYLTGGASILNMSGGPTIAASNTWSGPINYSYSQIYGDSSWNNFSNPAASLNSASLYSPTTSTSGPFTQTLTGTYSPQWFMNTSSASTKFWGKSQYEVYTWIEAQVFSQVFDYPRSTAAASLDLSTSSNHLQLLGFSVW